MGIGVIGVIGVIKGCPIIPIILKIPIIPIIILTKKGADRCGQHPNYFSGIYFLKNLTNLLFYGNILVYVL